MYYIVQYKEFNNGYDCESTVYMRWLDKSTANSIARHLNKVDKKWHYAVEFEPEM